MKTRLLVLVLVFLVVVFGLALVATQFDNAQAAQRAIAAEDPDPGPIQLWFLYCYPDNVVASITEDGLDRQLTCERPNQDIVWQRVCGPRDMVRTSDLDNIFGHTRASCWLRQEFTPEDLAQRMAER